MESLEFPNHWLPILIGLLILGALAALFVYQMSRPRDTKEGKERDAGGSR